MAQSATAYPPTQSEPLTIDGIVRLEDITEADAPALVVAEAELVVPAQTTAAHFRLVVDQVRLDIRPWSLS